MASPGNLTFDVLSDGLKIIHQLELERCQFRIGVRIKTDFDSVKHAGFKFLILNLKRDWCGIVLYSLPGNQSDSADRHDIAIIRGKTRHKLTKVGCRRHAHGDLCTGDRSHAVRINPADVVGSIKTETLHEGFRDVWVLVAGDKRCQSGNSRGAQKFSSFHNDKTINN